MANPYFTKEEVDWIRKNRNKIGNTNEVIRQFIEKFNKELSESSYYYICKKYKIKSDNYKDRFIYTQEVKDFIKENIDNYSYEQLVEILQEKYNYNKDRNSFNKWCNDNLKLRKKEKTKFLPRVDLGHEKVTQTGAIYVKVSNEMRHRKDSWTANYRRKTNIMYEKYHNVTVDDESQIVIQLDDNNNNFEKDNLYLISKKAYNRYLGFYNGAFSEHYFETARLKKLHLMSLELEEIVKEERKIENVWQKQIGRN